MTTRRAFRAGSFYPADDAMCRQELAACLADYTPPAAPERVVAGIVPHAGWVFSGPTAGKVFQSIQAKATPTTFVIFGAVHVWGVGQKAALCAEGVWETPCCRIAIDEALAARILAEASADVAAEPAAHRREHSIEVQIPFIQYLFPTAKFVPIMVQPDLQAVALGTQIGKLIATQAGQVIVIGSTDLTHYGPSFNFTSFGSGAGALARMKANDQKIIDLAVAMQAEAVLEEAAQHQNACGAGALAATVAAARALGGAQGVLLEHTTSQDVMPERPFGDAVGYAGIIF